MKAYFGGLIGWIDARFPLMRLWNEHFAHYYAPKNFNFWYFFGSLALLVLIIQIVTGIFLTMHYKPDAELAFASLEYIRRDVPLGWLIQYMHSTGASFFFIVVYLHMFRGIMYGSFKAPRELIWLLGMFLYMALMAEAFMGYLLPWGNMSYWGAQVIVNLFSTIPWVGPDIAIWLRGDFAVSDATLTRFFALHVSAIPLAILALVMLHIMALHEVGSNNPDGVEIKKHKDADGKPLDGVPFHPYYTVKDIWGSIAFLFLFALVVFFAPEMGGYFLEPDNFTPANPLLTPEHIVPVWYFTPFYSILRAIPDPQFGALAMLLSILVLFFLPWIDRNPVRSVRYRSQLYKLNLLLFVVTFAVLGYLGFNAPTALYSELALRFGEWYFLFFIALWFFSRPRRNIERLVSLAVVLGLISLYDVVRMEPGHEMLVFLGWLMPAAFVTVMFLGSGIEKLGRDLPVPDRVTE
ncbi:MAG: cytochrome b N-terminal domain-containing protein [Gammaproteobacteria bacterium]|nr:cytochrome b N-terminal domain-containing protein [Gammaproteobacteria bacterium]